MKREYRNEGVQVFWELGVLFIINFECETSRLIVILCKGALCFPGFNLQNFLFYLYVLIQLKCKLFLLIGFEYWINKILLLSTLKLVYLLLYTFAVLDHMVAIKDLPTW